MTVTEFLQSEPLALVGTAGVLGLMVGSFLNVVVHRLPRMLERDGRRECAELLGTDPEPPPAERFNLVTPRSRCPSCGHHIRAIENVPVLSYLALRGRCAACGWRIPWRYPGVEMLCGLLSAAVAWRLGYGLPLAGALLFTWALVALAFIDLDTFYLPDSITLPFLWLGLIANLAGLYTSLESAVIGAAAGYLSLWTLFHGYRLATGKEGMGYGDFKLLAMLGAWQGWQMLPAIILLSAVVGAVVGVSLIVLRGHDRNVPIPFGPYLALGGWVSLMWGPAITRAYLDWGAG